MITLLYMASWIRSASNSRSEKTEGTEWQAGRSSFKWMQPSCVGIKAAFHVRLVSALPPPALNPERQFAAITTNELRAVLDFSEGKPGTQQGWAVAEGRWGTLRGGTRDQPESSQACDCPSKHLSIRFTAQESRQGHTTQQVKTKTRLDRSPAGHAVTQIGARADSSHRSKRRGRTGNRSGGMTAHGPHD
jgi:hypothetical protein